MVDGVSGLDQLFRPGGGARSFDPEAEQRRVGGDDRSIVEVAMVGDPPKRGAQIG
jgi:hypothetical protein